MRDFSSKPWHGITRARCPNLAPDWRVSKPDTKDEKFEVYDMRTGVRVGGTLKSRTAATRSADRRDNKHGAYIHGVRRLNTHTNHK
jgi:hypothetical protein